MTPDIPAHIDGYHGAERRRYHSLTFLQNMGREQLLQYARNMSQDKRTGLLTLDALGYIIEDQPKETYPLKLLVADLQGLSKFNKISREYGNWAIEQAASAFRKAIRKDDIAARIGGDEFGVLAKNGGVNLLVDRVRQNIEDANQYLPGPVEEQGLRLDFRYKATIIGEPTRAALETAIEQALDDSYLIVPSARGA